MTRLTSPSLRARQLRLLAALSVLFVVITLSWVWWFAPRTTVFADLELQRLRGQLIHVPENQRAAWLQAHSGLEAFYFDQQGNRVYLARSEHPRGYRVWVGQLSVELPGLAAPLVLRQQAPRGIALLFDVPSLARVLFFAVLLAAAAMVSVAYAQHLLRGAVQSILAAFECSLEGRERLELGLDADPHLQPVVAAFEASAERLLATEGQLQQTLHRLQSLQQHKADVLASVSHDLRTPLTVIVAQSDSPMVTTQAEQLLQRVERVLEWSRLQAGAVALHWQEFELQEALEDALHRTGRVGHVQLQGAKDGVLVFSDFHWLSRVLQAFCASLSVVEVCYLPAVVRVGLPVVSWSDPQHLSRGECERVLESLQIKAEWGPTSCELWVPRL